MAFAGNSTESNAGSLYLMARFNRNDPKIRCLDRTFRFWVVLSCSVFVQKNKKPKKNLKFKNLFLKT